MQFTSGQLVIHPHHGPAVVEEVISRTVGGVERTYVNLRVRGSDLTVSLPADTAEEVGIRPVLTTEQVQELLAVLRAPSDPFEKQWSRRMKAQQELLLRGDPQVTAAVVRDLVRRDLDPGLAPAEKDLLKRARLPLLGELVEALGVSQEQAEEVVLAAIRGEQMPEVTEETLAS